MADQKALVKEEHVVEFAPLGTTNKIRLTAAAVSAFIAVPTRSGKLPSERDCIRFIMLCQGKRANPFEGDCYLIGYDGKDGPVFSLVCGLELFLKRAEQSPEYDGYEAGVVVERESQPGGGIELMGTYIPKASTLAGGWCKVFRKDRSHPVYKTVKLQVYNTGRSRWEKDPAGMIVKVAISQAHREAFPTALGGLYTREEMQRAAETSDASFEPISMPTALPPSPCAKAKPAAPEPPEPHEPVSASLPGACSLCGHDYKAGHYDEAGNPRPCVIDKCGCEIAIGNA